MVRMNCALQERCLPETVRLCLAGLFLSCTEALLLRGISGFGIGCLELDNFLLESVAFRKNLLSSPPAQGPPLYFVHERDHGGRDAPCRPVLKFITLMRALIFPKSPVLMVVETLPLLCHISYLLAPMSLFSCISGVGSSGNTSDTRLGARYYLEPSTLCNGPFGLCYSVFRELKMDLRTQPPRRWSATVATMIWLPRLIDKVRAFQAGTLGTYAYPSALDRSFMRRFQLTPAFIEPLVREMVSDEAIGAAIRQRIRLTDEEIHRRCATFQEKYRLAFAVLDRDDGYIHGLGYPIPRFLQPPLWRWYQRWSAQKASANSI